MTNKIQAAYILGQNAAMQKHARDRGGLTYNPTYSQNDIDAIRRYNKDVASGQSNWASGLSAAALPGGYLAGKGVDHFIKSHGAVSDLQAIGEGMGKLKPLTREARAARNMQLVRNTGKNVLNYAKANKGKMGLLALGGLAAGKALGYGGARASQGYNNYLFTDLNAQDRR
jgi:hypothetical protein